MAYSTVPYEELNGSPQEQGSNEHSGSFQATVNLKCKWEDRSALLADIVGNFRPYPNAAGSGANAISGTAKPYPGCTKNNQGDLGAASYDFAQVDVTYKLQAETKDLISETITPTMELLTLDYRRFRWSTNTNSAVMPTGQFTRMITALNQGFNILVWTNDPFAVSRDVNRVIINATYTKPCLMAVNAAGSLYQVSSTGYGPPLKSCVDNLQPMYVAVRNAWNIASNALNANQAINGGNKNPPAPPSLSSLVNNPGGLALANAGKIVADGPIKANADTNMLGQSADIKNAVLSCLGGLSARYVQLGTPITENEAPSRRTMGLDYGLTFYRVRSLPWWLLNYVGCVNNASVTAKLLGLTFPAGTLMFDTPNISRKWNFVDYPYFQVEFKLKFKPQGWNCFPRSDINSVFQDASGGKYLSAGAYDTMQINLGTDSTPVWTPFVMYPPVDFSVLWGMGGNGTTSLAPSIT